MSCTTLYVVEKNGDLVSHKEFPNSYRGAYLVWMEMSKRYGVADPETIFFDPRKAQEVWGLARRPDVAECDRITMTATFDRVVCRAPDLPRLVAAMRESAGWLPAHCSVREQADAIEGLVGREDVLGVAWNATSVTDTWADHRPRVDDEEGPPNLNVSDTHEFMFAEAVEVAKA